jgi:hypothetical protein
MTAKTLETKKPRLAYNLQFFAEPDEGGSTQQGAAQEPDSGTQQGAAQEPDNNTPTLESQAAEIAALKAQNAKLKNDNDKLCQNEGVLRKQLRAKMTAEEEAKAAKDEEDAAKAEHTAAVEKELAILKSTARYIEMGFDPKTAAETATADFEGDKETVDNNIKKMLADQRKKMEADIRAEFLANLPEPQSGNKGSVDYTNQINTAIAAGDSLTAISAILAQSQANN